MGVNPTEKALFREQLAKNIVVLRVRAWAQPYSAPSLMAWRTEQSTFAKLADKTQLGRAAGTFVERQGCNSE